MTRSRFEIVSAGLLFSVFLGAGCDLDFDYRRNLDDAPPPPDAPPAEDVRMCQAAAPEASPEYEAMCRHYCDTLEATLSYAGQNTGAPGAVSQSCYELRCVPRCVSHDLCVQQCHALGFQYQSVCANAEIAPDTACPVSIQERVDACVAGCDVWVPPAEPPAPEKPPGDVSR